MVCNIARVRDQTRAHHNLSILRRKREEDKKPDAFPDETQFSLDKVEFPALTTILISTIEDITTFRKTRDAIAQCVPNKKAAGNPRRLRYRSSVEILHFHPSLPAVGFQNSFADQQLAVAIEILYPVTERGSSPEDQEFFRDNTVTD
jgi:hypothetical protein